jgi:hypothetical protein
MEFAPTFSAHCEYLCGIGFQHSQPQVVFCPRAGVVYFLVFFGSVFRYQNENVDIRCLQHHFPDLLARYPYQRVQ